MGRLLRGRLILDQQLVTIGWFGGSVQVVVLMLMQQPQCFGRLGENANRLGPPYVGGVGVAVVAENVGDPIDGGFEPKGIASGSAGDDQLEAVLGCAAESHEAFLRRRGSPLFRGFRVGVNDRGLHQGLQPAEGDRTQRRGDALVDEPGLLSGELPGCCGDVAGLVGGHLPSQSRRPDAGKPVPQIKSVGDQAGG